MKINKQTIILAIILTLGFFLRIWGVNFGLPYLFHQDEPIVVNHAFAYGSGDLNPHFFIIPPLTSYILFSFYGVYFLILNLMGILKGTESFAISFFSDPTPFYLIGRVCIGIIPSLLNIYLTYKLSKKVFSKSAALYSAFIMAVAFLNVVNAHYIYTDNLLVLFILSSFIVILNIIKNPFVRNYILSGIFMGLAISIKYNAAILVVPFFITHLITVKFDPRKIINLNLLVFLLVIVFTFFVSNPFSVFDFRFFYESVTGKIRQGYIGFAHHVRYSLFEGLGAVLTVLGIMGMFVSLKIKHKESLIMLSFLGVFYIHLVFVSQPFPRYILPIIPFLAIGSGVLICDFFGKKKGALSVLIILFSLLATIPTIHKSLKANILFSGTDTRIESTKWIENGIPPFSKIALDHTFFRPQIKQTLKQIQEKQAIVDKQPELKELKNKKLFFEIKAMQDRKTYEMFFIIQGDEFSGQFLGFWPVIANNLQELKNRDIEYVVFNNMNFSESTKQLHEQIARLYPVVAVFNPYQDQKFRTPLDEIETTCIPLLASELFVRKMSGPCIIIYKLK